MTLLAAWSRLTEAPICPRCAEIVLTAALTAVKAVCAAAAVVKTFVLRLNEVAERELIVVWIVVFAAPEGVPSLMNTVFVLFVPGAATIGPRTASFEVTGMPVVPVFGPIDRTPAVIVALVPAESVPAVTALVIAVCKSEIFEVAPAVKTTVPP